MSDMVIFTRSYDLLRWLFPKAEGFPKLYRKTITQRLLDAALDFQEALLAAQASRSQRRLQYLQEADICLDKLRLYLRLIREWGWLSKGQFEHVSRMVAEIGRLLGGWIRTTRENG